MPATSHPPVGDPFPRFIVCRSLDGGGESFVVDTTDLAGDAFRVVAQSYHHGAMIDQAETWNRDHAAFDDACRDVLF